MRAANDSAIRKKLSTKFRANQLPRSLPNALRLSTLEGFEPMTINGGRGKRCCVCDEMITGTDEGSWEFTYPGGHSYAFHQRCEELWQDERQKPLLRQTD